jgi:hypothetical protein
MIRYLATYQLDVTPREANNRQTMRRSSRSRWPRRRRLYRARAIKRGPRGLVGRGGGQIDKQVVTRRLFQENGIGCACTGIRKQKSMRKRDVQATHPRPLLPSACSLSRSLRVTIPRTLMPSLHLPCKRDEGDPGDVLYSTCCS